MTKDLIFTPFLALLKKEIARFFRVIGQTLLVPLVNSTLYLLIFGVSLGSSIQVSGLSSYLAFLIPGLVMMGVLNNAFQNSSSSIGTSKFHGDLEDLRIVPLSATQIVWALGIGGLVRGVLVGFITFSIGEVFYRIQVGELLPIHHPFLLFFFLVMGGLSFSFLGISIAFKAKSIDQLSAITGFILLPLMYLGGVFFSLENLHPFWRAASHINPMLYFINGVRFGILGMADISLSLALAVSFLTTAALYGLALYTVRNGIYSRW